MNKSQISSVFEFKNFKNQYESSFEFQKFKNQHELRFKFLKLANIIFRVLSMLAYIWLDSIECLC